jgi:8-amino-7-oxononanoate synthase
VIDLTSSLYLGLKHDSASVPGWERLTTGMPAALATAPAAGIVSRELADLIGAEAATLAPSTLHAFWDLFDTMGAPEIHVDAGTYPIAWWGAERARCSGAVVRQFRHHDPAALRQAVAAQRRGRSPAAARGGGPVVLADGFCPGCGRVAPIGSYLATAASVGGTVVVDDTQALGVLGTPASGHPYGRGGGGIARWSRLPSPRLIVVASLAKGFGVPVATVAGSGAVIQQYLAKSETRVHCSPPSNAHLHSAIAALRINALRGDALRSHLATLVSQFRTGLGTLGMPLTPGLFPVQSTGAGARLDLQAIHRHLADLGVRTVLNRPRCRRGIALSFIFTAEHREADVARVVRAVEIALGARPAVRDGARSRSRAQAGQRPVPATRVPLTRSTAAARLLRPGHPQSSSPGPVGDRGDPWAADQFPADHLSYLQAQR